MISIDVRKDIFIRNFIKIQSYRSISRVLGISRGTVTKVCMDFIEKIKEMGLEEEKDLMKYIDKIVIIIEPKSGRESKKANADTKEWINNMVRDNENKRTRRYGDVKTIVELYSEFKKAKKYDKDGKNIYGTNMTYNNFYKLVTAIKKEMKI